ncbi:MAG: nucleotide exchange factor GrpE [Planctomycetia bacterium]|nr:nucleotide exchange factor GrpE [Planctomycetia bacterium]
MKEEPISNLPRLDGPQSARDQQTLGASTLFRLCEEVISLRERNNRQHTEFDRRLTGMRDELKTSFNTFAAETQKAYQQLRQEVHGEKRVSLALLNTLLEIGQDLEEIVAARPTTDDLEALKRWTTALDIESRKVNAALLRHGVHPYDAVISSPYRPDLHERVGSMRVEGMGPLLIAEQRQRGWASSQPEFVLRRPKVIVSE